jgi:hypothetical protein
MSCRRVNVEEVFKTHDGEFRGMSSGTIFEKNEVEKIGNFYWTVPNHAADNWEVDSTDEQSKKK